MFIVTASSVKADSVKDPLLMVQQAFDDPRAAAGGIKLHYLIGHAIQEETCHDDLAANPPRRCQFPEEPGVVGWKNGLESSRCGRAIRQAVSRGRRTAADRDSSAGKKTATTMSCSAGR